MDTNNFVIDKSKEKSKVRCIMIDETMITIKVKYTGYG